MKFVRGFLMASGAVALLATALLLTQEWFRMYLWVVFLMSIDPHGMN